MAAMLYALDRCDWAGLASGDGPLMLAIGLQLGADADGLMTTMPGHS